MTMVPVSGVCDSGERNLRAPGAAASGVAGPWPERTPAPPLRFSAEATAGGRADAAVTATLVDRASGTQDRVKAQYAIAADGAQSTVRQQLGVRMLGQENVYDSVNILLNADLRPWTADRPAALYLIEHPQMRGTFLTINGIDRWGFLVNSLAAYGYKASDFTAERSAEFVRTAAGVPDLDVKILGVVPWPASAPLPAPYRPGPT